ncbi:MAG TPA: hypothetical protein VE821_10270, partial [Pyrinomonadaceae bacterium]|nr:hypothetical protein [Pyrinomonadaceae bacterium]
PPRGLDGLSMLPVLFGQRVKAHEYLYWEFHEGAFAQAVRLGRWKGVRKGNKQPVELYDLQTDVGETRNLAAGQPEIVRRIEEIMRAAHTESQFWPVQ